MKEGQIWIYLYGQGQFIARNEDVAKKIKSTTKNQMVNECCERWPELLRDGSWSRKWLHSLPVHVLAVFLTQI